MATNNAINQNTNAFLKIANNLSDLNNAATARTNLGLTAAASAAAGQLPGTATNDSASAGNVGEVLSQNIASGSAVSLTTDTTANIASITLTAGDWDVWAVPFTYPNGSGAVVTNFNAAISKTSATLPTPSIEEPWAALTNNAGAGNQYQSWTIGAARYQVATTQTVYLVVNMSFTSTMGCYGYIIARRRR